MVNFKDREYKLDRHGFLDPPHQWDENFADGIAQDLAIHGGLTEEHWKFIRYLRDKFLNEGVVPAVVHACADNGLRLSRLRALFPTGYHRGACKIAGINFAFMANSNIWLTYESLPPVLEEHEVDETGYLDDFDKWNERFAHRVARDWDLPDGLTDQHWNVIRFLRDFYRDHGTTPTIFEACKSSNIDLDEFARLFPEGYHRSACRAAGLPFLA